MSAHPLLWWAVWPTLMLAGWAVFFVIYIRPMLTKIHITMGTPFAVAAAPAFLGRLWLHLEGAKTTITAFLISLLGILSADTSTIDILKDQIPWAQLVTQEVAIKITSILMFLITFLHLYGKLKAAQSTPQPSAES